jgi:hypothetical protein
MLVLFGDGPMGEGEVNTNEGWTTIVLNSKETIVKVAQQKGLRGNVRGYTREGQSESSIEQGNTRMT